MCQQGLELHFLFTLETFAGCLGVSPQAFRSYRSCRIHSLNCPKHTSLSCHNIPSVVTTRFCSLIGDGSRQGLDKLLHGSTASALLTHAKVPVLVMR